MQRNYTVHAIGGSPLPITALIDLSRMSDPTEQQNAFDMALSSKTPFKEVRKARGQVTIKSRRDRFHLHYESARFHATGFLTFDKHPDDVTPDDVANFLAEWMRNFIDRNATK